MNTEQNILTDNKKILYISRGIPGAGKSTKAKSLVPPEHIFSSDNFFLEHGKYLFSFDTLRFAHEWCHMNCEYYMKAGRTPLVIDNTNTRKKEYKSYVDMAHKYGYDVRISMPDSPWWKEIYHRILNKTFTKSDIEVFFEKNTHGVPRETICAMMTRWEKDE